MLCRKLQLILPLFFLAFILFQCENDNSVKNDFLNKYRSDQLQDLLGNATSVEFVQYMDIMKDIYYQDNQFNNDPLFLIIRYWYSIDFAYCINYLKTIPFDQSSWRLTCIITYLSVLYSVEKNVDKIFAGIAEFEHYRHYLMKMTVEDLLKKGSKLKLANWLVTMSENESDVYHALEYFNDHYSRNFPEEVLPWLEKMSFKGHLKKITWLKSIGLVAENLPEKTLSYINKKQNILNIFSDIDTAESDTELFYDEFLENFLTGIIYSRLPGITYSNLNVIRDKNKQFDLLRYYFYISNINNYNKIWQPPVNMPVLKRFEIPGNLAEKKPDEKQSAEQKPVLSLIENNKVIEPIMSKRKWGYNFYTDSSLNLTLICSGYSVKRGVFVSNQPLRTKIDENIIQFTLNKDEEISIYFPDGYELSLKN